MAVPNIGNENTSSIALNYSEFALLFRVCHCITHMEQYFLILENGLTAPLQLDCGTDFS